LRFAVEDLLGAGAIIHHLPGTRSPEAAVAEATFLRFRADLATCLQRCGSGRELQERNFSEDVILAAALNSSNAVPMLIDDAFVRRAL
jgi:2-phosphosulfolactate phosphatase